MPRTSWEKVGQFRLEVPALTTQRALADYLDRATARIDALIAAKRRMVELLLTKRQTVLTQLVTRGCDPGTPLTDSGTPWVGQSPSHWRTSKFTRSVHIAEGQVNPEVAPYADMLLIAPNHIESRTGTLLTRETARDQGAISGKYLCRKGDVIYSKIRPALRKATIAPETCLCSADMYPLQPAADVEAKFLLFHVLLEAFSTWAELESERVAMPKVNRDSLAELRVVLPTLDEQRQIIARVEERHRTLDQMRAANETSVALLIERRQALIYCGCDRQTRNFGGW